MGPHSGPDLGADSPIWLREAWAPSSSFSRFYSRTQGSEGLVGSGSPSSPLVERKKREPTTAVCPAA